MLRRRRTDLDGPERSWRAIALLCLAFAIAFVEEDQATNTGRPGLGSALEVSRSLSDGCSLATTRIRKDGCWKM
ncbi:hypothetical protein M673_20570 (plasmid) [Aureimonas sp. AU20]|nr:hypothetical protein M673_20570 [Aureimonas sp. AU20]